MREEKQMSVWDDFKTAVGKVEQSSEHFAASAAHALSQEAHSVAQGLKAAGHTVENAAKVVGKQAELFGEGAITGVVLNPINAVGQIASHVTGYDLPKVEFSNQNEVNNSWAGKAGEVAGSAALFVATDGAAAAVTGLEAGGIGTLAIAGALQGGLLTPTADGESNSSFIASRVESAALGAGSSAVMGAVGGKVSEFAGNNFLPTPEIVNGTDRLAAMAVTAVRGAIANGIGGAAGGVVYGEGDSLYNTGKFESASQLEASVASGLEFGALFGGISSATDGKGTAAKASANSNQQRNQ